MNITDEQKKILMETEADHEGHAVCTLALYPGQFRHTTTHGWLRYNGTHWEQEGASQAVERAITNTLQIRRAIFAEKEMMRKAKLSMSWRPNVTGTMAQIAKSSNVFTPIAWFDKSKDTLNIANGVLNLKTGELEEHSPKQLFTYCLDIPYEKDNHDYSQWIDFLQSVGLSSDVIEYLRLAVGYSLTGHTREEAMFYLYGPTRSGKGTFTEVLNTILGELATGVDMGSFTAKRYGDTSNFDLAPLKNKRFITASESQRYGQLNPAVIKKITGGDEIYCSFKRRDHFSYRPQFKIWLTSNFQVNTDIDDDAAWGRVRVIHFSQSFLGKEDKTLKDRLKSKKSLTAILSWCVSGAMDWYESEKVGLPMPEEVAAQTRAHRDALDSISQFLDQVCIINILELNEQGQIKAFTVGKKLYAIYRSWCEDEGYTPFGRKRFTSTLSARDIESGVRWHNGKAERGYIGIELALDESSVMNSNGDLDEIPGFNITNLTKRTHIYSEP